MTQQVVVNTEVLRVGRLLSEVTLKTGSANLQSIRVLNLARVYNGISS